ncbi:transcriptional regulator [Lichenibacterium dinghuense]|uniref:transcriptional regulator n=1 Tax=Lichenibacterium dinghuense TaxID=2895977 RepID=UPI001F20AA39|nr:transcriptional regulator [Lichenibacterium sp. 6Y81]
MITGKQIREARALLGLPRSKFAERAGVPHAILKLAEMADGECPVQIERARQIRRAIEAAGLELYGEGGEAGVRWRAAPPGRPPPG